jgi:hypothetical protein
MCKLDIDCSSGSVAGVRVADLCSCSSGGGGGGESGSDGTGLVLILTAAIIPNCGLAVVARGSEQIVESVNLFPCGWLLARGEKLR